FRRALKLGPYLVGPRSNVAHLLDVPQLLGPGVVPRASQDVLVLGETVRAPVRHQLVVVDVALPGVDGRRRGRARGHAGGGRVTPGSTRRRGRSAADARATRRTHRPVRSRAPAHVKSGGPAPSASTVAPGAASVTLHRSQVDD